MPTSPAETGAPAGHVHPVRVYYEDTDAGGIVYHTSYLRFAERGRTEYLRACGLTHGTLRDTHGGIFAVTRCMVRFRAAARLDDELAVHTSLTGLGGARLTLRQTVERRGKTLVELEVELAFVGSDGRPVRLPPALVGGLRPLQAPGTGGPD